MPETKVDHKVVDEAAEYLGVPRAQVIVRMAEMKATLHKVWNATNPDSLDALRKFYSGENPLHFYNVLEFNTWSDAQYPRVDFVKYGIQSAFDYGCGCGTTAVHLVENGIKKIAITELSDSLRKFAIWRLKKRGVEPEVVAVKDFRPLSKRYDLITCIDVMEHLPNPMDMMYHFSKHCKYFYSTALKPADISQHLNLWPKERIIELLAVFGFKPLWLAADAGRGFFESSQS